MSQQDKRGEVVLVTGSSGCLGQHIVKLLQEKDDKVAEIRLFDLVPYTNNLGHSEAKPTRQWTADIRDRGALEEAMAGVDCVIHTAALTDVGQDPDVKALHEINVKGTENVVAACVKSGVSRLVYTSTVDVAIAGEHIFYGMENTTPIPSRWLMGPYAETKYRGEEIVLKASGTTLPDGETKLRTAALRPTVFYGEEDNHFVTKMFAWARDHGGVFQRVHSLDERLQITYVGNVAWAHLNAKDKLAEDESVSGEAFYITDDTPIQDIYINTRPYFEAAQGVRLSESVSSYWVVWIFLQLILLVAKLVPIIRPTSLPPVHQLDYFCSTFFFNRAKATLRLDYTPLYTPEESSQNSLRFYSKK